MFLKTHKCASSTVQNILMRFADENRLTVVLPPDGNYLGHPVKFTPNLTLPLPSALSDHFNIFCHHTRWHEANTVSIMPTDTVYISILTDPASMFESLYNWVNLDVRYGVPLEKFMENPHKYYKNSTNKDFAKNPMVFDFGLDQEDFDRRSVINNKINELDQRFSLIMITEFMDESFVLLRELLCWEWEDLVVFRVNSRRYQYKKKLSPETARRIREWNQADTELYEYFLQRFQAQVAKYGAERMTQDVETLRDLTNRWYNFCVQKEIAKNDTVDLRFQVWHPSVNGFQLTDVGLQTERCIKLATAENPYTDTLRLKLWPNHIPAAARQKLKVLTQRSPEFW